MSSAQTWYATWEIFRENESPIKGDFSFELTGEFTTKKVALVKEQLLQDVKKQTGVAYPFSALRFTYLVKLS